MAYEWHRPLEKKWITFSLLTFLAVIIGGPILIIPPFFLQGTIEAIEGIQPYSALEVEGRDLYIREGCNTCHSPTNSSVQGQRPTATGTTPWRAKPSMIALFFGDRAVLDPTLLASAINIRTHGIGFTFENRGILSPIRICPIFAFLLERKLDTSLTQKRLQTLRKLGHPYSDQQINNAVNDAQAQAAQIAESIQRDGIKLSETNASSEAIALIAYLQSLGRALANHSIQTTQTPGER